jgi:hypothetical protein
MALATSELLTIPVGMPPLTFRGCSLVTIQIVPSFDTAALNIARHDLLELFFGNFLCIGEKIFIPITTKNPFLQIRSRGILLLLIHVSYLRFCLGPVWKFQFPTSRWTNFSLVQFKVKFLDYIHWVRVRMAYQQRALVLHLYLRVHPTAAINIFQL